MSPVLGDRQVALLVVAGLVVVSALATVASPSPERQDAPRESLTDGRPPIMQMSSIVTHPIQFTSKAAGRRDGGNATNTRDPANTRYLNTNGPTSPLTIRWTFSSEYISGLQVADGTVYLGAPSTETEGIIVYAFDAWTGEKRWQFKLPSIIQLRVFRDTVYVSKRGGKVYALDAATGERFWTANTVGRFPSLRIANRTLYVASENVYALNALTGKKRWRFKIEGRTNGYAIKDGSVYVSASGRLYAIDAQTGAEQWTFDKIGYSSSPAVANGLVYVQDVRASHSKDNTLYALDADTGNQKWAFDPIGAVEPPAVAKDTLYVGVRSNGLYALDATSGRERWHVRQYTRTPEVVATNAAYLSHRGSMYSLYPTNGSENGRFTPPQSDGKFRGFNGNEVLNGTLYTAVSSSDIFYALGTPAFTYTDLSVDPRSPAVNESVQVTATVRNTGTGPGEFNATLDVDGTAINATSGTVDPRMSRTITFTHTFQENGTYTVGIDGRTQRIGVGDVAPPPTPTPTATTTQTRETGTQESEATPTAPSTNATPTSSPIPGFGVGAGVAAVTVVIGLLAHRRWP